MFAHFSELCAPQQAAPVSGNQTVNRNSPSTVPIGTEQWSEYHCCGRMAASGGQIRRCCCCSSSIRFLIAVEQTSTRRVPNMKKCDDVWNGMKGKGGRRCGCRLQLQQPPSRKATIKLFGKECASQRSICLLSSELHFGFLRSCPAI